MLLSDHVYWVAVSLKITEQAEQQICIEFCIKLEHPSGKLFTRFRKWQLRATGDWQLYHDNAPTHASCLMQSFAVKHWIIQVTQPSYSPDLVPCNFWLFPKLKSPLKGKRCQTINEIRENMTRQLMVIGRTMGGPKVPALKGTEASLSYVQCFYLLQ